MYIICLSSCWQLRNKGFQNSDHAFVLLIPGIPDNWHDEKLKNKVGFEADFELNH